MPERISPLTRNQLAKFLPNHETIKVFESIQTAVFTDIPELIDDKVTKNADITGATKTKITYDEKGLVVSGSDATTADIADSTNKRYVTDAMLTLIASITKITTGSNANGYWLKITDKDNNNLCFIQARFNYTWSANTDTITWPVAFPDANYTVIGAPETGNIIYGSPVGITKTATQCDVTCALGVTGGYVALWLKS